MNSDGWSKGVMRSKKTILHAVLAMVAFCTHLAAAPFGRVVPIGGQAADVALDEGRGVLYVANFTANRIEVMSLSDGTIQRSLNVAPQPSSVAISPDGRWLAITHFGNASAGAAPRNSLTVIDLNTDTRQNFALNAPPLGVSFGIDNLGLVVTTSDFLLLDPASGSTRQIDTVTGVTAKTIPQPPANFPSQFTTASMATSGNGQVIYGLTDTIRFRYDINTRGVTSAGYTSSPAQGPRVVSVNHDGSRVAMGWGLFDSRGTLLAQHPGALGLLNVGGHIFDASRGVIYTQVPTSAAPGADPILQVVDMDNLTVRERVQLPENLAGKGVLSADANTAYMISDSGILILPVGRLHEQPRLQLSTEDLLFLGSFCDRRITTQEFVLSDPSGRATDFSISSSLPGVTVTPSTGTTPATIRVSVDPGVYAGNRGTVRGTLTIRSQGAVNLVNPLRVLINNREPDQRGLTINVPGRLVDILSDPARERFYLLRQDTNEVLVYDGTTFSLISRLKTGHTPMQMAITFDRRWLLVSADNSQIASVFDLETLQPSAPIVFPRGHYPRSIAASGSTIMAATRVAGAQHKIDRIDMSARVATEYPTLGVWENSVNLNTVLVASGNGSRILAAQADGNVMLYDANVDTFTVSRKDAAALSGAFAASSFDQFVVGNSLLNSSLVTVRRFDGTPATSSGFFFVDQTAFRTTASSSDAAGVIQRVSLTANETVRPTRIVEAPLLPDATTQPFTRTLAVLPSRNAIVNLSVSGFTVLPWNYDAAVAPPRLERLANSADGQRPVAPGGLISVFGQNLSPINATTRTIPLPTALGESCLTVNGMPVPLIFVSEGQINAQLPFNVVGNVTMILRTPGGVSDNFNFSILPTAPGIFRQAVEGLSDNVPTILNGRNGLLATGSNPLKRDDTITIYLTGMGKTNPPIDEGLPGPAEPLSRALVEPKVTLGGHELPIIYAGLTPGQVGVYQINARVSRTVPVGMQIPLNIEQGGYSTSVTVRVIE